MTPERAKEILARGSRWSNWSKHCTQAEDKYVRKLWGTLPGYTCWYDALIRIAKGEKPPEICPTCKGLKHVTNAGSWISCPDCNVRFIEPDTYHKPA